jgi:hypothetical protein
MDVMRDSDTTETQEWLDAIASVKEHRGVERANFIVSSVVEAAQRDRIYAPQSLTTPYCNTIPRDRQPALPGDRAIEHKLRSIIRWNALAIVLRANKESSELGGHIASFQSAATLYDIGFGHFWHAPTEAHGGDLILVQGHSSPGIYARAFLEGRLSEEQLLGYRQETDGKGLSSYPHPWLMPDFWQFPTVSMGLGPLLAIYQARFLKYLENHKLAETANRKGRGHQDRQSGIPMGCLWPRHRQWSRRGIHQATVRCYDPSRGRRRHCRHACRRPDQRNLPCGRDGMRAGRYWQDHPSAPDPRRVYRNGGRGLRRPLHRSASDEEERMTNQLYPGILLELASERACDGYSSRLSPPEIAIVHIIIERRCHVMMCLNKIRMTNGDNLDGKAAP